MLQYQLQWIWHRSGDVQLETLRAELWLLLLGHYCYMTNKQNSFVLALLLQHQEISCHL